jgi:S-DNA-T family DNA segregation ATPase FtsK/SpoIIIE
MTDVATLTTNLNKALFGLKINAKCVSVRQNRHMAFCDLKLDDGCKVKKIENCAPEIALAIGSKTEPIVKSIPSQGIVRLHIVMEHPSILPFDNIYSNSEADPNALLPFLLGETDDGKKLWTDFAKNPHTLIAGSTGSGKSVLLHTLIKNVFRLNETGNFNIRLVLVDPKSVEFSKYRGAKNVDHIATKYNETISILKWLETIMENTYAAFTDVGVNSVDDLQRDYPKYFLIIDEVADLMLQDKSTHEFERLLCRLAAKGRAMGLSIVAASQRPSVDIITGSLKANFPARIACKVASKMDSKVILDQSGAETLVRGDCIIHNYDNDFVRFQVSM